MLRIGRSCQSHTCGHAALHRQLQLCAGCLTGMRSEGCILVSQGPVEAVHKAALALGTANQLTNILRDVGEDAVERNRIYVPLEELDQFGIRESEVRPYLA